MNEKNKKFLFLTYVPILLLCMVLRLVTKERYENFGWISYVLIPSIIGVLALFWLKEIFFKLTTKREEIRDKSIYTNKQNSKNQSQNKEWPEALEFSNNNNVDYVEYSNYARSIIKLFCEANEGKEELILNISKISNTPLFFDYIFAKFKSQTEAKKVSDELIKILEKDVTNIDETLKSKTEDTNRNFAWNCYHTEVIHDSCYKAIEKNANIKKFSKDKEIGAEIAKFIDFCFLSNVDKQIAITELIDVLILYEDSRDAAKRLLHTKQKNAIKKINININFDEIKDINEYTEIIYKRIFMYLSDEEIVKYIKNKKFVHESKEIITWYFLAEENPSAPAIKIANIILFFPDSKISENLLELRKEAIEFFQKNNPKSPAAMLAQHTKFSKGNQTIDEHEKDLFLDQR